MLRVTFIGPLNDHTLESNLEKRLHYQVSNGQNILYTNRLLIDWRATHRRWLFCHGQQRPCLANKDQGKYKVRIDWGKKASHDHDQGSDGEWCYRDLDLQIRAEMHPVFRSKAGD